MTVLVQKLWCKACKKQMPFREAMGRREVGMGHWVVRGNQSLTAGGTAHVIAKDESRVYAHDDSFIDVFDDSYISALDQSTFCIHGDQCNVLSHDQSMEIRV